MGNNEAGEGLISVSPTVLLMAMVPLLLIAWLSHSMGLGLERQIVVGTFRSALQLSICGILLKPVFDFGVRPRFRDFGWLLVLLYCWLMVFLAAWEAGRRSKYAFDGLFPSILALFMANIGWVAIFAFGGLLQPDPVWSPSYVIPIVGMLLGNCINGVSLALDHSLKTLKEKTGEMELFLAFGATCEEATAPFLLDSIRVGTTPLVNSMAVIGLISIPGMMTGQILGGSPVVKAARYQILIVYLIAMCSFGTILSEVWVARRVGCDFRNQRFRPDRFHVQTRASLLSTIGSWFQSTRTINEGETTPLKQDVEPLKEYGGQCNPINLSVVQSSEREIILEANHISLTFGQTSGSKLTLFKELSFLVRRGELVSISAMSGAGKTQLLRLVAGLTGADTGTVSLSGSQFGDNHLHPQSWRRQVRYVSQYKIDILGTPRDFISTISSFDSWKEAAPNRSPTEKEMIENTSRLVAEWGLNPTECLDKDWKQLSGGESQRLYLAICLASRPQVLLMDESTASLDTATKIMVERTVLKVVEEGTSVLWISHDEEQYHRMAEGRNA